MNKRILFIVINIIVAVLLISCISENDVSDTDFENISKIETSDIDISDKNNSEVSEENDEVSVPQQENSDTDIGTLVIAVKKTVFLPILIVLLLHSRHLMHKGIQRIPVTNAITTILIPILSL